MENNNIYIIEFESRCCKNKEHNKCSNKWKGFGFIVTCTCDCHNDIHKKNTILDAPRKSSNTDDCLTVNSQEVTTYV